MRDTRREPKYAVEEVTERTGVAHHADVSRGTGARVAVQRLVTHALVLAWCAPTLVEIWTENYILIRALYDF